MDGPTVVATVNEVAESILSDFSKIQLRNLAFLGIQLRGVPLARRIALIIKSKTKVSLPVGTLDISMYRDDIGMRKTLPLIHETNIPFDLNRQLVILVDDVLQTGRTIRAALDAITDYGRPDLIRLAVFIDRKMREFPIQADYVGKKIEVSNNVFVSVRWGETDKEDAVYLLPAEKANMELIK